MNLSLLPPLNAILNGTAAVLIVTGFVLIKRGRREAHKRTMLAAVLVSTLFLASYLTHKFAAGHKSFGHEGEMIRSVYLAILFSHTTLAVVTVPLVIITVVKGLRSNFAGHKKIARWTLPIWLYVSVTGVVVFLMLY